MIINNFDLFVEFYNCVKESESMADVLKEYGGANIYVPSYKSTFRNRDILDEYKEELKSGKPGAVIIRELSAKHGLSYNSISSIVKENRQPSLFDDEEEI